MEARIISWTKKNSGVLFFLAITLIGALVRIMGRNFVSGDMVWFLEPWFNEIKETGGLPALSTQVGDYNILYQTIIAILSYIPVNCRFLYKMVSCCFDYALAFSAGCMVMRLRNEKLFGRGFNLAYVVVLLFPATVFNSSYWAQCDSIYTFFLLLTFLFLWEKKNFPAFIFYGLALGSKFQAIFALPFLVTLYFSKNEFHGRYFLVSLFTFWLTGLPAFLAGRNFLEPFRIYIAQTESYQSMTENCPNFWYICGQNYEFLHGYAICLTLAILGAVFFVALRSEHFCDTEEKSFAFLIWTIWTCVMFLPSMHERYTYPVEIFLLLLCCFDRRWLWAAAAETIVSCYVYQWFLFGGSGVSYGIALFHLAVYLLFSGRVLCSHKNIFGGSFTKEKPLLEWRK